MNKNILNDQVIRLTAAIAPIVDEMALINQGYTNIYRAKRLGAAGQWLLLILKEEVGNATAAAQVLVRSNVFSIVGNCMYVLRREIDIPCHDRLETENLLSDLNDFIRIWRPHIEHMNQQNPLFGRFLLT